jgi:LuxR family transcriptional activator of conjugal transfer of Ti plasmids
MSIGEDLMRFLVSAPETKTQAALGARLLAFAAPLGVTRYGCLYLRRDISGLRIHRAISNVPRDWQQTYIERGYHAADPVFQGAMRTASCGYWSELSGAAPRNARASEVMRFAGEIQMKEGFTRLVQLDEGGTAIMMASGVRMRTGPEARAALKTALNVFANEGLRMTGAAGLSGEVEGQVKLTPAQLRVLILKAKGRTNAAVAAELKRNTKTVETHASEIIRRLGASNMNEAIRLAYRLKLLPE